MKPVITWIALWVPLFWLWLLFAGDWNRIELIGAAGCATVAATIGTIAVARADLAVNLPLAAFAAAWRALPQIFPDFAIVMWALFTRRRGRVHTRRTDVHGSPALTNYFANFSPNAFVIDIDDEHVTLHDVVMHRRSESPA